MCVKMIQTQWVVTVYDFYYCFAPGKKEDINTIRVECSHWWMLCLYFQVPKLIYLRAHFVRLLCQCWILWFAFISVNDRNVFYNRKYIQFLRFFSKSRTFFPWVFCDCSLWQALLVFSSKKRLCKKPRNRKWCVNASTIGLFEFVFLLRNKDGCVSIDVMWMYFILGLRWSHENTWDQTP